MNLYAMMDKMILYIDLIKIFQQKKNLVQTGQEPLRYAELK